MSSTPSQSNEVVHAPFIENSELFPEDLEKWIWQEKEDQEKEKLAATRNSKLEVSKGLIFLTLVNPFQFLKNWKLKCKLGWVGIGGVRSIAILEFWNFDWD